MKRKPSHQELFVVCGKPDCLVLNARFDSGQCCSGKRFCADLAPGLVGGVRRLRRYLTRRSPARTLRLCPESCLSERRSDANQPADWSRREAAAPAQRNARRQPRQERPQQPRAEIDSPGRNQADGDEEPVFDETAARAAEILELLEGLRAFRQRIVDDAQKMAKEIKTPKEQVDACLANHPDICKIDASIRKLETELKAISDSE